MIIVGLNNPLSAQSFNPKNEELLNDIAFIASIDQFENHTSWNRLVKKLERKSDADAEYFLQYLFYKTHQKLLKEYNKGTTFSNLLQSGSYDCVSASITYSILLKYFNVDHRIIETDYHVFIIAEIDEKEYILETTDPRNGWISDAIEIQEFKDDFLPDSSNTALKQNEAIGALAYGQPNSKTIYKEISLRQLSALQFFNQGLIAIHNQDYKLATRRLQQALNLYNSERINTVFKIVAP
ncbi:hypothetical protein MATR_30470 [Marivirga tractuosa]|uniref:Protein SirB1 N-terminal domain-containing protein n=2 Tax=Marivirga TaxID=869806 RepID=E4TUL1_MARTH|nr:hypothetical protein Ftrac_3129 [Marivirga tractuosa DSM 4126]BDD16222.1 hypothetical protein MATR_30470 [Marivirga tractuosa]